MLCRLVAVCLVVGLPSDAAARWTRVQSENFTFVGDASEGQIRALAEQLEGFRETLLRALPGANAQSPVPTVVVVFSTDRSMTPVKPLFRGNVVELAGYFQSGPDVNYIAVNLESVGAATPTVFHEYAHFLVSNSQGRVPVWVNEGLAEFYEVTEQAKGGRSALVGRPPGQHLGLLRNSTLMPIKDLLAVGQDSAIYNEGTRRGVLYAQSWALVHYLTLGNAARGTQFRRYLAAMRGGPPSGEALGEGRTLSLRTKVLADVDLISYRPNPPRGVGCGPVAGRPQVYATYLPSASGGIDGVAVAIELLPDGFVPAPGR